MNVLAKITMQKKDLDKEEDPSQQRSVSWVETLDTVSRQYKFEPNGSLSVKLVDDSRPVAHKVVESFLNKFFPSGYPYSVNEGYLRYTQFRAMQHFTSAALSVLSTQSLLFAAGLRPTPAQATAVSWILKDGMQHVGKLICSNLGARMDSEPKRWRILADVLYDLGTGLEVLSPLCPHLFLEMAGLGNFAKGMATVAARATRLPIYSSFAKEGNLSDLFAKGEAISTLFNVVGLGAGIQLASTVCSTMQGKMVVGPVLSILHIYSVVEEMRAAPINTLNPQRTAMIVADFVKRGKISSPADLRYQEDLLFPGRLIEDAGSVKVGRAIRKAIKPSKLHELKEMFPDEKFILSCSTGKSTDMVLAQNATGEDALKGWIVAALAANVEPSVNSSNDTNFKEAYEQMNNLFPKFVSKLKTKGWHTDRFLDGTGSRFACSDVEALLRWTSFEEVEDIIRPYVSQAINKAVYGGFKSARELSIRRLQNLQSGKDMLLHGGYANEYFYHYPLTKKKRCFVGFRPCMLSYASLKDIDKHWIIIQLLEDNKSEHFLLVLNNYWDSNLGMADKDVQTEAIRQKEEKLALLGKFQHNQNEFQADNFLTRKEEFEELKCEISCSYNNMKLLVKRASIYYQTLGDLKFERKFLMLAMAFQTLLHEDERIFQGVDGGNATHDRASRERGGRM